MLVDEKARGDVVFWVKTYPRHRPVNPDNYRRFVFRRLAINLPSNESFERQWRAVGALSEESGREPFQIVAGIPGGQGDFLDYSLAAAIQRLSERAESFERYLLYRLHWLVAQKWISICDSHQQFILSPLLIRLAANLRGDSFMETFKNAEPLIKSQINRKFLYLIVLNSFLPSILKPYADKIETANKRWMEMLVKRAGTLDNLRLNQSETMAAIVMEAMERIRKVDSQALPFQVLSLMRALSLLHMLESDNEELVKERLHLIITMCGDVGNLFKLFLVLSVIVMWDDTYRELCSDEEHNYWVHFQQVMLLFIHADVDLSLTVLDLQSKLSVAK